MVLFIGLLSVRAFSLAFYPAILLLVVLFISAFCRVPFFPECSSFWWVCSCIHFMMPCFLVCLFGHWFLWAIFDFLAICGALFFSAEYLFWGISILFFLPERLFKLSVIFSALQGSFLFWVLLFRTFSWAFCPAILLSESVHFRTLQNTYFLWILWGSSTQHFFMVVLFLQHFIGLPFVPSTDLDALFFSSLLLLQPEPTLPFCGSVLCRPHFTFDISCFFWWWWRGGGWGLCVEPSSILILFFTILFF